MLKLYKDLNLAYFLTAFAGGIAILLPPIWHDEPFLPQALLSFVWILLCGVVFELLAAKRLNKLIELLNNCHTQAFLDAYDKLHSKQTRTQTLLALNRSAGLLNIGRPRQALAQLQTVSTSFPSNAAGAEMAGVYYNNLLMAHLCLRDIPQAQRDLTQLQQVLNNPRLKPQHRETLLTHYRDKELVLDLVQGRYDGAEQYLTSTLADEKILLRQVSCRYWLARLYAQQGRTVEAEKELYFVRDNGGDTWYAREAAKLLEQTAARSEKQLTAEH